MNPLMFSDLSGFDPAERPRGERDRVRPGANAMAFDREDRYCRNEGEGADALRHTGLSC
jgi:hypothetical protein